jgi:uncharacterized protein
MMLLDTSGFFCLLDAADSRHRSAISLFDATTDKVTHNYVLAELVALGQARRFNRAAILSLVTDVASDPDIELLWVDTALHTAAMALLNIRLDRSYSLCDAVSFIIMHERNIRESLTTDHHFEQEGFQQLLPSSGAGL